MYGLVCYKPVCPSGWLFVDHTQKQLGGKCIKRSSEESAILGDYDLASFLMYQD